MKKIALFAAIFVLILTQSILAQRINFGVKGGLNTSGVSNSGPPNTFYPDTENKFGLNFYLFSDFYSLNSFTFGAEAGYTQKGYRFEMIQTNEFGDEIGRGHVYYRADYIGFGIPVKLKYSKGNINPYAVLFPRVDFYLGYNTSTSGLTDHADSSFRSSENFILEDYKKTVFGITGGAGLELKNLIPATVIIESRYLFDLNKSFDDSFIILRNRSWEFNVGVRF